MRIRLASISWHGQRRLVAASATVFTMVLLLGTLLAWATLRARRDTTEVLRRKNLYMLYVALHDYADEHGRIPLAHTPDTVAGPSHSWRVSLLPYLDRTSLYSEMNLAEPWDSSGNRRLLELTPECYRSPLEAHTHGTSTSYFAVLGPHAPWWGAEGRSPSVTTTGRDSVLLIELVGSTTPWTKPFDPTLEEVLDMILERDGGSDISGGRAADIMYLTVGGYVRTVDPKTDRETVRNMLLGLADSQ